MLFVYIGLHDVVHHLVQLLLAYFLGGGQCAVDEVFADDALYVAHLRLLSGVYDRDRGTLLSGSACASATVGVVLYIVGESVVDDMGEVAHVESSCSHVGSHEQLHRVLAELLHRQVALLLRQVTMQRFGVVAIAYELVGYLLCLDLGAAEDDGEDAWVEVYHALESQILVLGVHHIVDMVDVFGTLVARAYHYLLVVVQIVACYALYLLAHGGREEQRVAVFGHSLEDSVDAVGETHVEHLVGLVEHHVAHMVETRHATVHQVDESSRGSHDNLHAVAQGAYLRLDGRAAIYRHDMYSGHILGKVVEVVGYLEAQLTRGAQDERLRLLACRVDALEHGNTEGSRLAGAGLCQGYHVVAVAQEIRDYFFLDRHGMLKSKFTDGAANVLAHAQFFKCLQCFFPINDE